MELITLFNVRKPKISAFDDRVMGGNSQSKTSLKEEMLIFDGTVRTDNNGGFCSCRINFPSIDVTPYTSLTVKAAGTPRTFELRLFDQFSQQAIAYQQEFLPSKEINEYCFFLDNFMPTFRGRPLANKVAIDASNLCAIGLLTGKKKIGDFSLLIYSIKFGN